MPAKHVAHFPNRELLERAAMPRRRQVHDLQFGEHVVVPDPVEAGSPVQSQIITADYQEVPNASAGVDERQKRAGNIVRKYMLLATAAAIVPFPVLDLTLIFALQVKMLKDMTKLYNVEYSEQRAKIYISALLGTTIPAVHYGLLGGTLKSIPFVGSLLSMSTLPVFAAACTYAVGRVFTQHFELGGAMLDFQPEKVKAYFKQQYEIGRKMAFA